MDLCVKLLLLVGEDKDFDVRVRGAATVHGEEISCLQDSHSQLQGESRGMRLNSESCCSSCPAIPQQISGVISSLNGCYQVSSVA